MNFEKDFGSSSVNAYINNGSGEGITIIENETVIQNIRVIPRVLTGTTRARCNVKDKYGEHSSPFVIGPSAFHKLATEEAEIATAKAAEAAGIPYTVSCFAGREVREIREWLSPNNYWQQLYIFEDKSKTEKLIRIAEENKASVLVITVGTSSKNNRTKERETGWKAITSENSPLGKEEKTIQNIAADINAEKATWKNLKELKKRTKIPIVLKGIMHWKDAKKADSLDCGIVVSNHGGRQHDNTATAVDVINEIRTNVRAERPLFVDGGIRSAQNSLAALAIGANRIFLGRPILWKLREGGDKKLEEYLKEMKEDLEELMVATGCKNIEEANHLTTIIR